MQTRLPSTSNAPLAGKARPQDGGRMAGGPGGPKYTIAKGDTLSHIAAKFKVDLKALLKANPQIKNPDAVEAGAQIRIPVSLGSMGGMGGMAGAMMDQLQKGGGRGGIGGMAAMMGGGNLPPPISSQANFKALPGSLQRQLDDAGMLNGMGSAMVRELLSDPGFQGLSTDQKSKSIDVFSSLRFGGRRAFLTASQRKVNGKSALLDKGADGSTIVDNLHRMAKGSVDPGFQAAGVTTPQLMASVLREAGDPGGITQDSKGTCTVTSMQYLLAKKSPAEYTRALADLTSSKGAYKAKSGATIPRDDGLFAPDSATMRSHSSRVFQASMMEYANGSTSNYDNVSDTNSNDGRGGLANEESTRAMKALFGAAEGESISNETKNTTWFADGSDAAKWLTSLKEGETFDSLKDANDTTVLSFYWGDGSHMVSFEKIENGRLYFRNPHGRSANAAGTKKENPPRRIEDPKNGIESMALDDVKKYITGTVVSD